MTAPADVGGRSWADSTDESAHVRAVGGVAALRRAVRRPPPAPLTRWAAEIADPAGDLPLLGTGSHAGWFEALQWNGARHRVDPVLIAGLLAAPATLDLTGLGRALLAADAVTQAAAAAHGAGPAIADVQTLGCAAAVCLAGPLGPTRLTEVLDVAAGLMVLSPASVGSASQRTELMRAGHPVAAGRLSCEVVAAGLTGSAAALAATLLTVTGPRPVQPSDVGDVLVALR